MKNEPKNGNLDLSIYKNQNGKFWLRKFGSTYLCNRLSHRELGEGGKVVTGCYSGVVIKIPILVLPVLLYWWWMMMMMMMVVQWGLTIVAHLTAGGWWRTYSGLMPSCGWISDEDLQWFDASFTSWWGGAGVITSYVSFMGHSVGTAFTSLWWLCWCHPGTLYPTVAWTAAWPRPQTWCKPPWPWNHLRTCTWGATKQLQLVAGWVCTMVPVQETPLRGAGLSQTGTVILLWSSLGGGSCTRLR